MVVTLPFIRLYVCVPSPLVTPRDPQSCPWRVLEVLCVLLLMAAVVLPRALALALPADNNGDGSGGAAFSGFKFGDFRSMSLSMTLLLVFVLSLLTSLFCSSFFQQALVLNNSTLVLSHPPILSPPHIPNTLLCPLSDTD